MRTDSKAQSLPPGKIPAAKSVEPVRFGQATLDASFQIRPLAPLRDVKSIIPLNSLGPRGHKGRNRSDFLPTAQVVSGIVPGLCCKTIVRLCSLKLTFLGRLTAVGRLDQEVLFSRR